MTESGEREIFLPASNAELRSRMISSFQLLSSFEDTMFEYITQHPDIDWRSVIQELFLGVSNTSEHAMMAMYCEWKKAQK